MTGCADKHHYLIVCYGSQDSYYDGARFLALKLLEVSSGRAKIVVYTERPDLFSDYPIDTLELSSKQNADWRGADNYHFRIKIEALADVIYKLGGRVTLLDTDLVPRSDPTSYLSSQRNDSLVMFRNEGRLSRARNPSSAVFWEKRDEIEQKARSILPAFKVLESDSMWGSAVCSLHERHIDVLRIASRLTYPVLRHTNSHTTEPFCIAQSARAMGLDIKSALSFFDHWSTSGRKKYGGRQLRDFFSTNTSFSDQQKSLHMVRTNRPLLTILVTKVAKWFRS